MHPLVICRLLGLQHIYVLSAILYVVEAFLLDLLRLRLLETTPSTSTLERTENVRASRLTDAALKFPSAVFAS
jgi:hypothetical protein